MLIDRFMPEYHVNEVHTILTDATPEQVYRAIREVSASEIPLLREMFALRSLPALLMGRRGRWVGGREPFLDQALRGGFIMLADEPPRELVVGTIGKFWQASGGTYKVASPEEFLEADAPGYAKAILNFYVGKSRSHPNAVRVRTETRVHIPGPAARRKFRLYWQVIYPGSALIRVMWLRAIKRRAEEGERG